MGQQRTVVLIGSAHPLRGGLAAFNERLIREYRKRGDDAQIYTFSLQYPGFLFPGKTQYSSEPSPEDIPIHIKVNSINPVNWIRVGMELKRRKPDIVIVKFWIPFMAPCFGTICRIIRKNRHSLIISILDNIIPHEKRPGDKFLAQYWVNCVDGFITMSESVRDDLKTFTTHRHTPTHTPTPTLISPHPLYDNFGLPVDKKTAKEKLKLDPALHYMLFFGFIRDYKGLDLLMQAIADERIRAMPVKLLVAGEFYTDPAPYHEIIRKYDLGEKLIMVNDFIPDSEVVNYFCAVDLVVQPYKSATQSGISQIAYHFDKPMIITDVGGLAELVPDGKVGYVVKPGVRPISDAIVDFYTLNKEEEFSRNAATEKLKYSWANMLDAIDSLIYQLTTNNHK